MTIITTAQESMGMGLTATRARPAKRDIPKSRGGRPTKSAAIERDQRLIEVATRLFLDRGYDATSLDAVAESARVSKPTVYARYGDKRGLFAEVLRREIARWLAPLSEAAEGQLTRSSDISVEQRLIEVGREMLTFTCGPRCRRLQPHDDVTGHQLSRHRQTWQGRRLVEGRFHDRALL
jgi:AcrR family transcriptional regulator